MKTPLSLLALHPDTIIVIVRLLLDGILQLLLRDIASRTWDLHRPRTHCRQGFAYSDWTNQAAAFEPNAVAANRGFRSWPRFPAAATPRGAAASLLYFQMNE